MIAASAALTVIAAVLFVVGVVGDVTWIWASIGASLAALVSLIVGVLRGRPAAPVTVGGVAPGAIPTEPQMLVADEPITEQTEAGTLTSALGGAVEEGEPAEEEAEWQAPAPTRRATPRKTTRSTASKSTARKPAKSTARKTTAKSTARKPAAKSTARKTAKPAARKPAPRKRST